MRTDIPDPTPLDEALWSLYCSGAVTGSSKRSLGRAVSQIFPERQQRLWHKSWALSHPDRPRRHRLARDRRTYQRTYRLTHPDPRGRRDRAAYFSARYHGDRREALLSYARGHHQANRDERNARARERWAAMPQSRRDELNARRRARLRQESAK